MTTDSTPTHPPTAHLRGMASLGWAVYGMNEMTNGQGMLGDRQDKGLGAGGQALGPCRGRSSFLSEGIWGMGSTHPASSRMGQDRSASVKSAGTTASPQETLSWAPGHSPPELSRLCYGITTIPLNCYVCYVIGPKGPSGSANRLRFRGISCDKSW